MRHRHMQQSAQRAHFSPTSKASLLGEGTFATVHCVTDLRTGELRALKTVKKELCERFPGLDVAVQMEMDLMRSIGRHPHIVGLVDSFETQTSWSMVLELATGGQVFDRLAECGQYSESRASNLVRQVGTALLHVHDSNVCHRDVKPENLVFETCREDSNVLLCDFGVSMPLNNGLLRGQRGTQSYMAPEMLNDQAYGKEVDMWSLGVILYSLLSGSHPFDPYGDLSEEEVVARVQGFNWERALDDGVWEQVSPQAKEVVQGLMRWKPAERWT